MPNFNPDESSEAGQKAVRRRRFTSGVPDSALKVRGQSSSAHLKRLSPLALPQLWNALEPQWPRTQLCMTTTITRFMVCLR
jgi:hypothetical protein